MTDAELLAEGCRILAGAGHDDSVFGHASVRQSADTFLLKGSGLGLSEVTAEDMALVDLDGVVRSGGGSLHNEWPIHAEVLRARADVGAVVHTHPTYASAFSALAADVAPVTHEGAYFSPQGVARFDKSSALVRTPELGAALAATLGPARGVLLRNHGMVTVGADIREAVIAAIVLETACRRQLLVQGLDGLRTSSLAETEEKRPIMYGGAAIGKMWDYYRRLYLGAARG